MDNRTERLIRENAEAEHTMLTPVRWLTGLVKEAYYVVFALMIFGVNATWWIVGCGSMGWRDRQERVTAFVSHTDEPQHTLIADYAIMFDNRGAPVSSKDAKFWHESPWLSYSFIPEGLPGYAPATGISISSLRNSDPLAIPVSFCSAHASDQEPGMDLEGWFDRSRTVFGRKASRMYEAYVSGAAAVTALRVTLTELKLGRDPLKDLSSQPGQSNSLCHVDPFDVLTTPDAEAGRWEKVSKGIDLDAPRIRMRTVPAEWEDANAPSRDATIDESPDPHHHSFWIISGMCLEAECVTFPATSENYFVQHFEGADPNNVYRDDLNFYVSAYADLFYSTPPLSEHQTHAVNSLNDLATDDYWIIEAHKNGVYDDATVRAMAARARVMITRMIAPDKAPHMNEGDETINVIGAQ